MAKLKKNAGLTLLELMVATLLTGVVFMAAATPYVSGLKLMSSQQTFQEIDPFISLGTIARNISLANEIGIRHTSAQLSLRLDYNLSASGVVGTAKKTAATTDDTYISYRFINGGLRYQKHPAGDEIDEYSVTATDPEVVPGFACTGTFAKVGTGNSNSARMTLTAGGKTYVTDIVIQKSRNVP